FGPSAVRPLLLALRAAEVLTAEQRERLPQVLAGIGPAAIPHLLHHLRDENANVRDVVVAALGRLHAPAAVHPLPGLRRDPDPGVRESLATALGEIGSGPPPRLRHRRKKSASAGHWFWRILRRQHAPVDPEALKLEALRGLLEDEA